MELPLEQHSSSFRAQARSRQAKFRETSETVSELASTPDDELGRKHGYYLTIGHENENLFPSIRDEDRALKFFKERSIKWWRSGQSGDTKGKNIPTRNMASSQIACVNFLLPLATESQALIAMLNSIDSDIVDVNPMAYELAETRCDSYVEFEWIGLETTLEFGPYTRGANATSVDALLIGKTAGGSNRAYLFEWKYTEEYRIGEKLAGGIKGNETRRKRYSESFDAPTSPFVDSELDDWFFDPLYQIMRLILLSEKMIRENEFDISNARVIVSCPRDNLEFRKRVTSPKMCQNLPEDDLETAVKRRLKNPDIFSIVAVEDLFDAITRSGRNSAVDNWVSYHRDRYGWY